MNKALREQRQLAIGLEKRGIALHRLVKKLNRLPQVCLVGALKPAERRSVLARV